ncbi:hypothetical protein [Ruegeria atlantica]|uniref:Glycosyl transferase family 2 n=1 Tax=Ruegeria atlantica TaxID=81569 RepID=A0A0N7LQZ0_9RHOB|nr:hypothetical protein [Ruegeria atlantica]CUH49356.1 hypothetical protein RUA4292_03552 [Ruegeria atlantica]
MSLAVVTMVYDDYEFLPIWVRYWSQRVENKCMYVIVHGSNRRLRRMARGCNVVEMRRPPPSRDMEVQRWNMLGHFVSALTYMHDAVLYTDVDEILTLDPNAGTDITDYILNRDADVTASYGLEIIHREDHEPEGFDPEQSVLQQRGIVRVNTSFGKPSIVKTPIAWRRGGHFAYSENVRVDTNLVAFHLRFFDMPLFRSRAVRRRKTTKAPKGKNNTPSRAWRASDTGIDDMIRTLHSMPIAGPLPEDRSSYVAEIENSKVLIEENGQTFTKHRTNNSAKLFHLAPRFKELF